MKTQAAPSTITSTLDGADSQTFKLNFNGKAAHVLISQLYANKVGSIVRELMSNAFDGHARCRKLDVPFAVHLPTRLDPEFRVRDYGCGMDHEFVMELYSTLFYSDKGSTNKEVGMLGLGSKSPFAYTDSFTVKAHDDGITRTYLCHKGTDGIPVITRMDTRRTGEETGVEISFAAKEADFRQFRDEVVFYAAGFDVRPTFQGDPGVKPWGVVAPNVSARQHNDNYGVKAFVRQGCVLYPLSDAYARSLGLPQGWEAVINVPIGKVSVTASREAIELDDPTKAYLNTAVRAAAAELATAVVTICKTPGTDIERARKSLTFAGWECARNLPTTLHLLNCQVPGGDYVGTHQRLVAASPTVNPTDIVVPNVVVPHFFRATKGRPLVALTSIHVRDIDNMRLILDDGTKVPRRLKRLHQFTGMRNNQLIVSAGADHPGVKALVKYLDLKPTQVVKLEDVPDVYVAPRGTSTPTGRVVNTAKKMHGKPWIKRDRTTWHFPAFNDISDRVPSRLVYLAEMVGLPIPAEADTLTPKQAEKAVEADRWDLQLMELVKDPKHVPFYEKVVTLGFTLNGMSRGKGWVHLDVQHDARQPAIQHMMGLDWPGFVLPTNDKARAYDEINRAVHTYDLLTEAQIEVCRQRVESYAQRYPMLFGTYKANVLEYVKLMDESA